MLGHHYQRDEVIEFADVTGDSFKLAKEAAARPDAPWIVFCGVHFMAESADILTQRRADGDPARPRRRLLDGRHGRRSTRSRTPGTTLVEAGVADDTIPVTYMNSSAAIKAFTGRHGGTICTSSNAKTALRLGVSSRQAGEADGDRQGALPARPAPRPQHLRPATSAARSTDCVVWDPHRPMGGLTRRAAAGRQDDPLARALLGARPVHRRGGRAGPPRDPGRQGHRAPRVPARGRRARRRGRLDREDHQDHRRRAGRHDVGGRHRAQPRAPARGRVPRASRSPSSRRTSATARR